VGTKRPRGPPVRVPQALRLALLSALVDVSCAPFAESTTDLARVVGEVVGDLVQAEVPQDRGGRLALQEESERRSYEIVNRHVLAPEHSGKLPGYAHEVPSRAGTAPHVDTECTVGLMFDGDPIHLSHANHGMGF
jgi:hypothetical protein